MAKKRKKEIANAKKETSSDAPTKVESNESPQVVLTDFERLCLVGAFSERDRVNRDIQIAAKKIMEAHGFNGDHTLMPIDLTRGVVQILTNEQMRMMQAKIPE